MRMMAYAEKAEKFSSALAWMSELARVNTNSRFYVYQKIWKELIASSDLPDNGISPNQFNRLAEKYGKNSMCGAILETDELIDIYDAFQNDSNVIPISILEKIANGKFSETEEEADKPATSQPRNFLFELTVAAKFQSLGFHVKLNEDADIVFNFRNYKVFVECKRLFGEKNFEFNLRRASDQLTERYKQFGLPKNLLGICPIGFNLFSLTKVFNSEQLFLIASSGKAAVSKIDNTILEFVKRYNQLIMRKSPANTIGTGFYIRVPVCLPFGTGAVNRWLFFPHYEQPEKFRKISDQIGQKFERQSGLEKSLK